MLDIDATDPLDSAPLDIWADLRATETRGITSDDIRDLWQRTWPALGELESTVFELALSDRSIRPTRTSDREAEAAREALTAAYMGVVKSITVHHAGAADRDDIRQTALVGLWQGFREAERGRKRPLETVQRNVLRALSDAHSARFGMTVPEAERLVYAKVRKLAAEQVQTDQGESDVDALAAELAPEHGMTEANYWRVHRVLHLRSIAPDGTITTGLESGDINASGPEHAAQPSTIEGTAGAPLEHSPVRDALVVALLARLTDAERRVIVLRYGLEDQPVHTEEEAAAVLGRTTRRVRQIVAGALAKLREPLAEAPAE